MIFFRDKDTVGGIKKETRRDDRLCLMKIRRIIPQTIGSLCSVQSVKV